MSVLKGLGKKSPFPKNFWALAQYMEYIRAFLLTRLAFSRWAMLGIVLGAFGIFNRNVAIEVVGYSLDTATEDYDIIMKMHRYMFDNNWKCFMCYVPSAVCITEAPMTFEALKKQRKSWQYGTVDIFFQK